MRILYVCRVFTGLESSLAEGRWAPTGVPTIYKVMEGLAGSKHEVKFVLAARGIGRDYRTDWASLKNEIIQLKGFTLPFYVMAGESQYPKLLGRLRGPSTTVRHLLTLRQLYKTMQPDLVYVDRAHVLAGALLARNAGAKVVVRIMGIYPSMWDVLARERPMSRLERWAYQAPFAHVVCTQDGTGGENWMSEALSPEVPRTMMVNGIDHLSHTNEALRLPEIPADKIVVLFIGRLEWNKGSEPFVRALLSLPNSHQDRIHAIIVGTGTQEQALKKMVGAMNAEHRFTFIDRVPHTQIKKLHVLADIYVSLNKLGQLSNSNLEVMAGGHCMILSEPSALSKHRLDTRDILADDAVFRISAGPHEVSELVDAIIHLSNNPDLRASMTLKLKKSASTFIKPWNSRVDHELALLERVADLPLPNQVTR